MIDLNELRDHVLDLMGRLCEPLHDQLELASARSAMHLEGHGIPSRGWQHTHLTRAHLCKQLSPLDLYPFTIRTPNPNGRLLMDATDGSTLRILHAGPGGSVPPPGPNLARVRYYQQQQLPIPHLTLASALLALWSVSDDGAATFRIARPIGKWTYGGNAQVDLDFALPRKSSDLEELEFRPDDSGLNLDIPSEELQPNTSE